MLQVDVVASAVDEVVDEEEVEEVLPVVVDEVVSVVEDSAVEVLRTLDLSP